ncbi:DedA family protein [Propionibacteriaceae bacterium Y1700]|uniref:DedA family protein n=1 Tax=Microlunatus sp. Y1700 TaxID=3418487 RepID=UPI003DA72A20
MEQLTELLVSAAGSPVIYLVVLAVCAIDGFFPPVPSETTLVTVAAIAATTGQPHLLLLGLVAAIGSIIGDNIAFALGRRFGTSRLRRSARVAKVLDWAGREMAKRPASLILVGRYIPVGRVAVNMTAGATGLPHGRFLLLSSVAGICWATYSLLIATFASAFAHGHPLLAAGLAIVFAVVLGVIVDRVIIWSRERAERVAAATAADPVRGDS